MKTRNSLPPAWLAVLVFAFLTVAGRAQTEDIKTICFIGHKTSHGFGAHEYHAGNHLMGKWLEAAYPGRIKARYSINWPENETEFFAGADSVVFFCSGGRGHLVNRHVERFDRVMKSGAGLACLHYAVEVPIGPSGKGMLAWMGGYFETNWSVNPHWVARFEVFPNHPVSRGLKPFEIDDEWYFHMRFRGGMENVTPILSALAPEATMKRKDGPHSGNPHVRKAVADGKPQHVAWVYQRGEDYGKGRGFGFTGLHYHWNWQDDNFRKAVLNGVAWTAHLPIPENGVATARPSREQLEANILEYGGEQNRKKKPKPAPKPASSVNLSTSGVKPLFASGVIDERTPGHFVNVDVEIPANSRELFLVVLDAGALSFDWADWCEPTLVLRDGSELKLTGRKWKRATVGWGKARVGQNAGGGPLRVGGKPVADGIGVHANSILVFDLPEGVTRFRARGGIDNGGSDQSGESSVQFLVFNRDPGNLGLAGSGARTGEPEYVKKTSAPGREPEAALKSLTVHPDLKATLFAAEPMTLSPSAIDIDHRGRVWVCEVVNYRRHQGKRPEGDRILILEDRNQDGKADQVQVFYQGKDVDSAHGICVLGDRVIVSAGDDVFSLYDRNGDGRADEGSKELLFTKISGRQHDHGIHAFHFGPDGRLYFNFGNAGKALHDGNGKLVIDRAGNEVRAGNLPYQEGMVFRCELDGSGVETLGWNFRNNWEAAVDSFGTIWQSDNDDDGNKGVRINYVMEYGNFGYKDELTRAGWRDRRIGMEEEVPRRHWHLNDPGVVPNLLQTGAGSPTGICVYEGELLPSMFRGQPIHCDAGPNVVRAYPVQARGGGYEATMVNLLENTSDRWFRPSDVCVAPDGSLMVADWYDPGVGGHAMGDLDRGRIFWVTPKAHDRYAPRKLDLGTPESAIEALFSPNQEARYLAWTALARMGDTARPALHKTFAGTGLSAYRRARVLWLLARLDQVEVFQALNDQDANLRITALRAIRQLYPERLLDAVASCVEDADPGVRREAALALRFEGGERAHELWGRLAVQADGKDRWTIEALGIGADLFWEGRQHAYERCRRAEGEPGFDPVQLHAIQWRSRDAGSAYFMANHLGSGSEPGALRVEQYLRGLQFKPGEDSRMAAYEILFERADNPDVVLFAANELGPERIGQIEGGQAKLDSLLEPVMGKPEFIQLVERMNLKGYGKELGDFVATHPDSSESVLAAKLLFRERGVLGGMIRDTREPERAAAVVKALGRSGERDVIRFLAAELRRKDLSDSMARGLVLALASSGSGGRELIKVSEQGQLTEKLHFVASAALARSPDAGLRQAAQGKFKVPAALGMEKLPAVEELVNRKGNAEAGKAAYVKAACITCHKVRGEGIDFGPDLTEIGNKLSKEALYESILYPSVGISHGFQGVTIKTRGGGQFVGYATGETAEGLTLRLPGGVQQSFAAKEILERKAMEESLMPPGLAAVLSTQEFVDLIAYLQRLKG